MMQLRRRFLVLAIVVSGAAGKVISPGCPQEPLRVVGKGQYSTIDSNRSTTCEEITQGACPYAAPFPEFPCLVNCIASEHECVRANRATAGVDEFVDKRACTSCGITACADCKFVAAGRATCRRCFPGFIGVDGPDGEWGACALWDHNFVLSFFFVLFGLVGLVFLVILAATCVTAYKMTLGAMISDMTGSFSFSDGDEADTPGHNMSSPLLEAQAVNRWNSEAIHKGLMLSLMSSIKASSMRRAASGSSAKSIGAKVASVVKSLFDDRMTDLGLGLQLFFKTQIFLIVASGIVYIAAESLEDRHLFDTLNEFGQCGAGVAGYNITSTYVTGGERYSAHAKKMQIMCSSLWFLLIIVSLGFHVQQKRFIEEYDKQTYSAEDYCVRLDGVPDYVTSEKELKRILQHEFRCLLYGVSIIYDVQKLENPEEILDMTDHIVEWDDMVHGWTEEKLATPKDKLKAMLEEDSRKLQEMLKEGKLKGSGQAFVAFKTQKDLARVVGEHRGVSQDVFRKKYKGSHPEAEMLLVQSDAPETVFLSKDTCEPAGLRWFRMWTPAKERMRQKFIVLPLRMILYIGIYAVVSQLFFSSMIKPWQDNFIEGAESASSVKVISKLVLLFNFGIQTLVMIDVDEAGFNRVAQVDQTTFVWNTVLLLVTNAYVFMQDCFREGVRWDLSPPDPSTDGMAEWWEWQRTSFQSVHIEKEVGKSLVNTMTEQIMMLYVLGEVANVLLPVIFFYLAIRFTFLYHADKSGSTFLGNVQKRLRGLLLRSTDEDRPNITVREAERAQILVPLLLWMEYTYIVIFPAMAFITFYLVTDQSSVVCGWLFGFSIIFFIWQRYVMLWLYGKSTFDSQDSYDAFILMWGFVLSMLPPASVWWAWRLGEIIEYPFVVLTMVLVYFLSLLSYVFGVKAVDAFLGERDNGIDEFGAEGDPGYSKVIEEHGMSWWNVNPVYVLKHRHCPTLEGHEVQDDDGDCHYWPKAHVLKGYFELGKEFKQLPKSEDGEAFEQRDTAKAAGASNGGGSTVTPELKPGIKMTVKEFKKNATVSSSGSPSGASQLLMPAKAMAPTPVRAPFLQVASPSHQPTPGRSPRPGLQPVSPQRLVAAQTVVRPGVVATPPKVASMPMPFSARPVLRPVVQTMPAMVRPASAVARPPVVVTTVAPPAPGGVLVQPQVILSPQGARRPPMQVGPVAYAGALPKSPSNAGSYTAPRPKGQ